MDLSHAESFAPWTTPLDKTKQNGIGASIALGAAGSTISIVTAVADNLLFDNSHDPIAPAQALASSTAADIAELQSASDAHWASFWAKSSISLPSAPVVEEYWYGAQYATNCMTATDKVLAANKGLVPPSGLYGPWVTTDKPSWNGDYTLDYNQEAQVRTGRFLHL